MRTRILLTLCLVAVIPQTLAQVVPQGPEFHIMLSSTAFDSRVTIDSEGRFLAGFNNVFSGRINLRGWDKGQLQDPFVIAPRARYPSIAELGSGEFVVTWSAEDSEYLRSDIFLQTFELDGTPLSSPAQINVDPVDPFGAATAVARRPDDLIVVWHHTTDAVEGASREIRARLIPFVGPPGSVLIVTESQIDGAVTRPQAAATIDGRALVVWRDQSCAPEDPSDGCIRGRHYTAAGVPTGGELMINSFTTGSQSQPAVAAMDDGFVVAWESMDCGDECIRVRRFNADATALGPEVRVDLIGTDFVDAPSVGAANTGEFVVAWARSEAFDLGTFARAFNASGLPLTSEFQINSDPASEPYETATAMTGSGEFVVVWSTRYEMWGRRFELELESIFEDSFESGNTSAWSLTMP